MRGRTFTLEAWDCNDGRSDNSFSASPRLKPRSCPIPRRRFVTYLLGTNVSQVSFIVLAIAVGLPLPLKPLVILVVNLIVDGMPALSYSMEPVDPDVMNKPPRSAQEPVLTSRRWSSLLLHSVMRTSSMMVAYTMGLYWHAGRAILASDIARISDEDCTRLEASSAGDWQTQWVSDGNTAED